MRIWGVTGTNGKTTTTWIAAEFINAAPARKCGYVTTVEVNTGARRFYTGYTTPPLTQLKDIFAEMEANGCTDCVMEVSSHAIHQHRTGDTVFSGGAFTNLSEDHLDYHKTMEAYFDVKLDFARRIAAPDPRPSDGRRDLPPYVVCLDGGYGREMFNACGALAVNVLPVMRVKPRFDLSGLQLVGDYNQSNVLVAAELAAAAGVPHDAIQGVIPTLRPRWGRLEYVPCAARAKAYVDFAHTPDGLEKVLAAARGFTKGRLWVVFGAGGDRDPMKRPLMGAACARLADRLVVTSDNPRSEDPVKIIDAILEGVDAAHRTVVTVEPDRREAIRFALENAAADDVVIVAGKGHETTQEIKGVKHPFDDREVVRGFLPPRAAFSTRRAFIGGGVMFGAFSTFGGLQKSGTPRLRFGVISDLHVGVDENLKLRPDYDIKCVEKAFKWFCDQGVDAVMICGDISETGIVDEVQVVAEAWFNVFPGDRAPDGHKVERLFIYGNHDWGCYADRVAKMWPDPAERARHILHNDFAGHWKRVFGENYAPIYRKTVKGYDFIGVHWDGAAGYTWQGSSSVEDYLAKIGPSLNSKKPFFYFQHSHPKDTCYGSWAWGRDDGQATRALSRFPNAVAFSGHSHFTLTDERAIWQGAFTSIGASSMHDAGFPYDELPTIGYENTRSGDVDARRIDAAKMMDHYRFWGHKQGMLVSVYDNRMVIARRDFRCDLSLGPDWIVPLPVARSRPFMFDERTQHISAPAFKDGAKLVLTRLKAKNRAGEEKDAVEVRIPAPVAKDCARAYRFEVVAEGDDARKVKYILAEGFNQGSEQEWASASSRCVFAVDELPKGKIRFIVTPENCFHRRGASLLAKWE